MLVDTIPRKTVTGTISPDFIQARRTQLEERLALARERSQQPIQTRQPIPFNGDFVDQSSGEVERTPELRLAQRESCLILKILAALQRIKDGEYGTCEQCGEPIGEERLQARPVTTLCIDCKKEEESLENSVRH